jgi:preprotein translocase subunit SecA
MRQVEKIVCLRIIDMLWLEHLENMNYLRDSVRLRAYGQRDPLVEYKSEGHKMFQKLLQMFESSIVQTIFRLSIEQEQKQPSPSTTEVSPQSKKSKVGRNDPCPCGSGKKYKKCCYPKYG